MSWYVDEAVIKAGETVSSTVPAQDRTIVAVEADRPVLVQVYGRIEHETFRPVGAQDGPPNTTIDLRNGIAVLSMAALQGLSELQFRIKAPVAEDVNLRMSVRTFPND